MQQCHDIEQRCCALTCKEAEFNPLLFVQAVLPLLRPLAEAAFADQAYSSADDRLDQLLRVANVVPCCPYRISIATRIRASASFLWHLTCKHFFCNCTHCNSVSVLQSMSNNQSHFFAHRLVFIRQAN